MDADVELVYHNDPKFSGSWSGQTVQTLIRLLLKELKNILEPLREKTCLCHM